MPESAITSPNLRPRENGGDPALYRAGAASEAPGPRSPAPARKPGQAPCATAPPSLVPNSRVKKGKAKPGQACSDPRAAGKPSSVYFCLFKSTNMEKFPARRAAELPEIWPGLSGGSRTRGPLLRFGGDLCGRPRGRRQREGGRVPGVPQTPGSRAVPTRGPSSALPARVRPKSRIGPESRFSRQ